jgi:desulfoferrodoxin (superoxide reductase-like protein)
MRDVTEWSRRGIIGLAAAAAAGLVAGPRTASARAEQASADPTHRPRLRLPARTANGARVPIVVEVPHPMEPAHRITALEVVNPRDPVPLKGRFHFSEANGRPWVAFQARFDEGPAAVVASAECGRHGRSSATVPVTIEPGAGGCAGGAPAAVAPDEIRAPVIRIPQLVADGFIAAGAIIDVQVKTRHPNRTGLALEDGRWVQASAPFHLAEMEVVYGDEPVSRFRLTAALSDNPMIAFKLRAVRQAPVRVTLVNTRGERFEAMHAIRWG